MKNINIVIIKTSNKTRSHLWLKAPLNIVVIMSLNRCLESNHTTYQEFVSITKSTDHRGAILERQIPEIQDWLFTSNCVKNYLWLEMICVFYHISGHNREKCLKYEAQRSICDKFWRVWKCRKHFLECLIYVLSRNQN